jgi:hypothetical protein
VWGDRSDRGATGGENKRALPSRRCSERIRVGGNRCTWVQKPWCSQKQRAVCGGRKTAAATVRTVVHSLKPTIVGTVALGQAHFVAQSFFQLF